MILKITCKNCELSEDNHKHIQANLEKIVKALPHVESDLIVFRLTLKRNTDKYHPQRTHPHSHKTYSDKKPSLAFYEGSITFRLDKNRLYVHFKGRTIDECINLGFERIFEEIEKFKDIHYTTESEYPDHSTIREKVGGE